MDGKALLQQIAPWLAAAATGGAPGLIAMAATQLTQVIGKDVKPSTTAITAAVAGATPDQLLALKQADNDFAIKMQALGFDNEQKLATLAATDRDSARQREISTHDWTPRLIAFLWLVMTGICEGGMLFGWEPKVAPELVGRVLGSLDSGTMLILMYYYGSNALSGRKTELIAQGAQT